jgi:pimeloyl-ACP methyl ester carboxylesterase
MVKKVHFYAVNYVKFKIYVKYWKNKKKEIFMILFIILTILLFLPVLSFFILRVVYPSILYTKHKTKGQGIDIMEIVEIGNIKQFLYLRGKNIENPVILFIHGGPGSPMIPLLHGFQYNWENDFTIVQWDQRNSGKTFFLNDPETVIESMNFEQMLSDAHEVTQYIKEKLNKDAIIILGHSWGSVLGTALVHTYPQDYIAYIGVGQIANMRENTRVGYEVVLETARIQGNKNDVVALEALASYLLYEKDEKSTNDQFFIFRKYLNKYKLAEDRSLRLIMLAFSSPYYKFRDLMYYLNVNILHYQAPIFRFLDDFNIRDFGTMYEIPVFYIMGERDYQTPYPLAKMFFDEISAPIKEFFTIKNAGHLPMLDNKKEFNRILLEIKRRLFQE